MADANPLDQHALEQAAEAQAVRDRNEAAIRDELAGVLDGEVTTERAVRLLARLVLRRLEGTS